MKIRKVDLIHIVLPIKEPFVTGCGVVCDRHVIVTKLYADQGVGFGEVDCNFDPIYSYETTGTALDVLEQWVIPRVLGKEIAEPAELVAMIEDIRGHNMAKSGLELAFWDVYSKIKGQTIANLLGGKRKAIVSGVSVGMKDSIQQVIADCEGFLEKGYQRLKVKVRPGKDVEVIRALRTRFPDVMMMADANSSYRLDRPGHVDALRALDEFNLTMIEQPLQDDDIVWHRHLQKQLKTPICLDEAIHTPDDAKKAIELGSCGVINIKVSRVGGLVKAKQVHDICQEAGIPVWVGSMLESGIGEAYNIHLAALENCTLPGDVAPSDRYFTDDLIEPLCQIHKDGTIDVPSAPGMGFEVDEEKLKKYAVETVTVG